MIRIFIIALLAICTGLISEISADCSDKSCLGGLLSSKPSADYDSLEKAYTKVNDYIFDNFPDEKDPEKDLEKAIEWLETKPKKLFSRNSHLVVLDNLKSLKSLKGDISCNSKSLKIMEENDRGTGFQTNKPREFLKPLRRIEKVVRHYSEEHSKSCAKIYLDRFAAKYKEFGNEFRVRMVEHFVRGHIYGTMKYVQNHYNNFQWTYGSLEEIKHPNWRSNLSYLMTGSYFNATEVYDFIDLFSRGDSISMRQFLDERGLWTFREDSVKTLLDKYFIGPCNYYVEKFGPEIFEPAAYDAKMEDEGLKYLGNDYIIEHFEFYFGLECFQICSTLDYRITPLPKELNLIAADPNNRTGRY